MNYFVACLTFVGSLVICALIAWLGGFNFDQRTPDVAFGFTVSVFIPTIFASMVGTFYE